MQKETHMKKLNAAFAALCASLVLAVPVPAFAQFVATPIPSADVVDQLGEINVFVLAVGGALLLAAAIAVALKWGKATIFG